MAEVRAFGGIRYDRHVGDLSSVICAPYDVITPDAQAAAYARSPHNAIRLELGVTRPTDDAAENRYTRAAATIESWLAEGVLIRDSTPGVYVYEERFDLEGTASPSVRRGFFARVRLAEWSERVVLPHERTLPKPRADRLSLLRATRTNLSPVFALYDDPDRRVAGALDAATAGPPTADVTLPPGLVAAAADRHRLWRVDAPEIVREIESALAGRQLYIADGHHRYETALEYWRERRAAGAGPDDPAAFLLMHLVDLADSGLIVRPTHRLVRSDTLDRRAVLEGLRRHFVVEEAPLDFPALLDRLAVLGRVGHAFGIAGLAPGRLHVVAAPHTAALDALLPAGRSSAWRQLDVAVLHSVILERILGLDAETGAAERLAYTRDPAEALAAVESGEYPLAVFLNPTKVEQIRDVALAGDRMPEKSTYFWPKPPTGLVFYAHATPHSLDGLA